MDYLLIDIITMSRIEIAFAWWPMIGTVSDTSHKHSVIWSTIWQGDVQGRQCSCNIGHAAFSGVTPACEHTC